MTEEQFWEIVNASREAATGCEAQVAELQRILSERSPSTILEFDHLFRQKVIEAYRWDLWGVAYLIQGGCSDDSFDYFCYWLIGRGDEAYKNVLEDPQTILTYLDDDEETECEGLIYASSYAYESVAGEEMPVIPVNRPSEPTGEAWEEEDLAIRFPTVAERYL